LPRSPSQATELNALARRNPHRTVRETLVSYGSSRPGQTMLPVVRSRQFLPDHRLTVALSLNEAAPSLQLHYRAFLTTTSDSAPVLRLGTQGLAGATCLTGSLHIGATGSHVPYGSQDHGHATSMPDAGWAIIGHPPTLSQERDPLLVSTSPENVSTRHQWFAHARLRDPHLTGIAGLFRQRSRQRLLTDAAWGGLKPAPESRLRRAYLHLPYSSANPLGLRS
jgi:hypothetical protein